jgi:hypothetical protein
VVILKSKQRGRPPFPPEIARSRRVVTFVTELELVQLQRIAERRKLALSATIHEIITEKLAE